jgi:NAD(P)H-flavin reductase
METTLHKNNTCIPLPYRINALKRETHDTVTLVLESAGSKSEFEFEPGQFNMLYAFGMGEVPISISGNPANTKSILHTIRKAGKITQYMTSQKRGDIIGVRGPYGNGWPCRDSLGKDIVIIAGGIGLAPLRPAIYHLLDNRGRYGRIVILYGARTPIDLLYKNELMKWRGRFDVEVDITVDRTQGNWRANIGVVPALVSQINLDPLHTVAFVCGPEIMMRFSILELNKHGIEDRNIYISMERNMQCAVGLCGHCQFGPNFICKDGPVFRFDKIKPIFSIREI